MENDTNRFDFAVVIETAKRVITTPADFYRSMPKEGGYANPVVFVVVMSAITGLIGSVWALFGAGPVAGMATGLLSVLIVPVFVAIGSFIGAVVLFVIWKLMGSTENYESAYRCLAFGTAILPIVALANLIPYLGQLVHVIWGFWLMLLASEHVHKIAPKKALIVFGILGLISLFSNLSAEYQARKVQKLADAIQDSMIGTGKNVEEMTPEEIGKATADFLTGFQQGSGGEQLTEAEKAQMAEAGAAVGSLVENMQNAAKEWEKNPGNMEDVGAAMGGFFQKLQEAADAAKAGQTQQPKALLQVTELADLNITGLEALGKIDKPSSAHHLQFGVNDDARYAPLSRPAQIYRDGPAIRYRLWFEQAYFGEFASLHNDIKQPGTPSTQTIVSADMATSEGGDQRTMEKAMGERNINLHNAGIYLFDKTGNVVGGDECQQSILQIPADTPSSAEASERDLWLVCPLTERNRIAQ